MSVFYYLLFLVESLLVTVWYAETSGVENVCDLEAAENALNLSPTGTLQMREHFNILLCPIFKPRASNVFHIHKHPLPLNSADKSLGEEKVGGQHEV